jgi:hypothetical protein
MFLIRRGNVVTRLLVHHAAAFPSLPSSHSANAASSRLSWLGIRSDVLTHTHMDPSDVTVLRAHNFTPDAFVLTPFVCSSKRQRLDLVRNGQVSGTMRRTRAAISAPAPSNSFINPQRLVDACEHAQRGGGSTNRLDLTRRYDSIRAGRACPYRGKRSSSKHDLGSACRGGSRSQFDKTMPSQSARMAARSPAIAAMRRSGKSWRVCRTRVTFAYLWFTV